MELRQLEAFAAVMSTGSVTAAGRLLGRSQPAISRLIQDLEAELGYALFARSGPRVMPSEQGFLLYEDVEPTLANLQQLQARARQIGAGTPRPLRLAATPALAAGLLPHAIARAEACFGARAAQVRSASPERVIQAVLNGSAQLGVTSLPLEHRGLTVHWIGEAPCVLALPDDDPLATLPVVPLARLAGRRVITMANPYRLRHRLDQALASAGAGCGDTLIETNASVNALASVRCGLGVALLEPVSAYGTPLAGVAIRPIDTHIPFFFGVITPQAAQLGADLPVLAQTLADSARDLLPDLKLHEASAHASLLHQIHGDDAPSLESAAS
ncbi:LysR family transcriptional regulator [Bordetella genomosp. 1]|uniref:LysR family transcriptional regulator n=1 Tax=Bordetella genomosp. 1 TaxID=1395607 RepID=A0A261SFW7_9BORD|nr:LysR family transcriptional regulator [Bordetella genomosp. 1]OZI36035.1 LysR family transcriptional regulator [Bordetella genomosp. 1]OZI58755.1 LysR family transcriptional regulator [Bordetella genomosp. 1]